jgi:hypothetical protein
MTDRSGEHSVGEAAPPVEEFALDLVKLLVNDPRAVSVRRGMRRGELRLSVRVAPDDAGQVIGRDGRTARALRTVLKAAARRRGEGNLFLEIED